MAVRARALESTGLERVKRLDAEFVFYCRGQAKTVFACNFPLI